MLRHPILPFVSGHARADDAVEAPQGGRRSPATSSRSGTARIGQPSNMKRVRWFVGFVVSAGAGFATPSVVPQTWLSYILGTALFLVVVWAALAGGSAKGGDESSRGLRAISWLVAGTSRPTAEVVDNQALGLFWITLIYLVSFNVGAFAAVRP